LKKFVFDSNDVPASESCKIWMSRVKIQCHMGQKRPFSQLVQSLYMLSCAKMLQGVLSCAIIYNENLN